MSFALWLGLLLSPSALEHLHLELQFDQAWSTYLMKECGCPTDTPIYDPPGQCNRPRQIDVHSFGKAREFAKKVFQLKDE